MKRMILTGWGYPDYGCAAAAALRDCREAQILGISMEKLPDWLNAEGDRFEEIYILGVGLTADPVALELAAKRLALEFKVRLCWLSTERPKVTQSLLDVLNAEIRPGIPLTEVVGSHFEVPFKDLQSVCEKRKHDPNGEAWRELLEAAAFCYRMYGQSSVYPDVIRKLSLSPSPPAKWGSEEKKILDLFHEFGAREIKGGSKAIRKVRSDLAKFAKRDDLRVMIQGETGVGKEVAAWLLYCRSPRFGKTFLAYNCAAVSESMIEDKLFGHEKGAFTGALRDHKGLFEQADGGTLFLDEVGEMPLTVQAMLLRALELGVVTRIGGERDIKVDVRVISATNRNLARMVQEGRFRADLYYRLCDAIVTVPPLRNRLEDLEFLAGHHWERLRKAPLPSGALEILRTYDYPGNVRELISILRRAALDDRPDFASAIRDYAPPNRLTGEFESDLVEDVVTTHCRRVFERVGRNKRLAAKSLGLCRKTLEKYLVQ